ncbi:MAG: GAF domain-containing protein [Cytophagales bacterium]
MSNKKNHTQFQTANFKINQVLIIVIVLLGIQILYTAFNYFQNGQMSIIGYLFFAVQGLAFILLLSVRLFSAQYLQNFLLLYKRADAIVDGKKIDRTKDKSIEYLQMQEVQNFHAVLDELNKRDGAIVEIAEKIGKKDFSTEIVLKSNSDTLGIALNAMKKSLQEIAIKDEENNWSSSGQAAFAEVLRRNYTTIDDLCYQSLEFVVKYVKANQGFVFMLNDEDQKSQHLELKAAHAYERKKFIEKKIEIYQDNDGKAMADGLTGQAFLEKTPIFLTKVPKDFVKITSGMGEATASCVFIVPLKVNDEVSGVIELASFSPFNHVERDFVVKIAEMLGSTIISTKISDRTKKLLDDTQKTNQEMREKEEELRQNMEELSALQEELHRNQAELLHLKNNLELEVKQQTGDLLRQKESLEISEEKAHRKEKQVIAILNGMDSAIFLATEEGKILVANETASSLFGISAKEILNANVNDYFVTEKIRMRKAFHAQVSNAKGEKIPVEAIVNKLGIDGVKCNLFNLILPK